jgi:hypothetical protein
MNNLQGTGPPPERRGLPLGEEEAAAPSLAGAAASDDGRRDKRNRGAYRPRAGSLQDTVIIRLRRQRHVEALHALGPRVVFEFIDELTRHHRLPAEDLDRRLKRYAGLAPAVLRAVGGDRFPPRPLRVVR